MAHNRVNVQLSLAHGERLSLELTGRQVRALIDAARKSRGEEPEFTSEAVSDYALKELHRCLEFVQAVQEGRARRRRIVEQMDRAEERAL